MRISDWSSDVCSSDLALVDKLVIGLDRILQFNPARAQFFDRFVDVGGGEREMLDALALIVADEFLDLRSEEHTSELQSLMRISYAVFCLKKNQSHNPPKPLHTTAIHSVLPATHT